MSDAQIRAFIEAAKADAGLQEQLKDAADVDAVVEIAKRAGFALGKDALLKYQAPPEQLTDAELERVAGGLGKVTQKSTPFRFASSITTNDLGPDNTQ